AVRELRDRGRFRTVLAGRLAREHDRAALARLFARLSRLGRLARPSRLGRPSSPARASRLARSRRAGAGAGPGISGGCAPRTP
ncbi:hypothetical protein, partial [Streptomyces apricus]|uniref:hypothetical protein n=1 Tax=Streptomyces apricus TaxID=1828112 RepID=UPI001CAA876C